MGCRLPTIGRYKQERSSNKEADEAKRRADKNELTEQVAQLRDENTALLCQVAEFVNKNAEDYHGFFADRREARIERRNTMGRELREYRAKVRADMERIVSTDFI